METSLTDGRNFELYIGRLVSAGDLRGLEEALTREEALLLRIRTNCGIKRLRTLGVASVTLAARAALVGGLPAADADKIENIYYRRYEETANKAQMRGLHHQMLRDFTRAVHLCNVPDNTPPELERVMSYIRENIYTAVPLQELARRVGRSRGWLLTNFRLYLGTTPSAFILRARIEEAKKRLVISEEPVKTISDSLGFSSPSYFQKVFRAACGDSPSAWRRNAATSREGQ